jgi:hypothetical protein
VIRDSWVRSRPGRPPRNTSPALRLADLPHTLKPDGTPHVRGPVGPERAGRGGGYATFFDST